MRAPASAVRLFSFLSLAGTVLLASCGKDSTGVQLGGVASVAVSPAADTVYIGSSTTLTATPEDADGNALTGREIFWHSEHPDIAVVTDEGAVTGVVPGEVRIAASVEGVAGYSTVTVLPKPPASLELSSNSLALTVGQESRLGATVRDADGGVLSGAPVDWKSSNANVATVDGSGLVHGVGAGSATITATSGSVKDEATVTVSPVPANAVVVSPGEATLFVGETVSLKATVTDANGDPLSGRPISWSTSSGSVASVSTSGVVTAVAPGTATITATSEGKSGKSTITVKKVPVASVNMDPGELRLEIGKTGTITATPKSADGKTLTGRSISWNSRDPGVATVNSSGTVTAKAAGSTLIEATSEGVTGVTLVTVANVPVASVVVTPDTATLVVGQSKQLSAKTFDSGGDELNGRTITWSSSNENVASVSSTGKVLAVAPGSATITATSEGKSDKSTITVIAPVSAVTVQPDSISVIEGNTSTLTATVKDANGNTLEGRTVTWESANTNVATVDGNGVVTGVAPGATTVTATSEGKSGSAKVVVTLEPVARVTVTNIENPDDPLTVVQGQTLQLAALLADADGNALLSDGRVITWASDDQNTATVNNTGLVSGVNPGKAKITATSEGVSGSADVTVTSALEGNVVIVPADTTLSVSESADLKGMVIGKDGKPKEDDKLSWSSNNELVARVSDKGRVQALLPGSAIITAAKDGKGESKSGTANITVVLFQ
ncbi:MAG TPA: Ig-like domain-containing protein [Gemmatimonadaceae bacterium]|nr:Ig-like domain-containing protein [Gemmatimonadaceae bacterium]